MKKSTLPQKQQGTPKSKNPKSQFNSNTRPEQLELLPPAPFKAFLPSPNTLEEDALIELVANPAVTQEQWVRRRKSWRLAAVIHKLNEAGWCIKSTPIPGTNGQASYSLTRKAKQAAYRLFERQKRGGVTQPKPKAPKAAGG
jgi:hypothetical protein